MKITAVSECGRFVRVSGVRAFGRSRWLDLTIADIEEGKTVEPLRKGVLRRRIDEIRREIGERAFVDVVKSEIARERKRRIRVEDL